MFSLLQISNKHPKERNCLIIAKLNTKKRTVVSANSDNYKKSEYQFSLLTNSQNIKLDSKRFFMKYKFFAVLACIALSLCCSCNTDSDKGGFTLPKKINTSNKFRIDGYYYLKKNYTLYTYVFYGDGQVIDCCISWDNFNDIEYLFESGKFYDYIKVLKRAWGRYILKDGNILMEYPYDFGSFTKLSTGVIKNNTTLFFSKIQYTDQSGFESLNETLHFKAFSPKPDSTYIGTN